ncbi:glycosyltransferase family 2 protein [Caldovatus sediminis]|uniref:glycosyltransferase family 2 protein n=1 Tax=Caldovatus sediminis TaxID=2041189 RepID=UPI0016684D34|nr:glycosyltransferase family 2 protein [Caldovatus sediminis]
MPDAPGGSPLAGLGCLVLAHENAPQIRLLLDRLTRGGARCWVHLDRRAEETRAALHLAGLPAGAELLPRQRSFAAEWGGFAMVEATLALMRAALAPPAEGAAGAARAPRALCLLSGTHLPIRPAAEIADLLLDGREHADLRFACAEPPERESLRRFWYPTLRGREQDSRLLRLVNRNAWRLGRRDLARGLRGMTPMVGSQWWCLTAGTARRMLEFLDANPWYARFFRLAHIPDESFFQTLLGAFVARGAVRLGPPSSYQVMEGYGPRILGVRDLPPAFASGLPFARKFDSRIEPEAVSLALAASGDPAAGAAGPGDDRTVVAGRRRRRGRSDGRMGGIVTPAAAPGKAAPLPDGLAPVGAPPAPRAGEILALIVARNEALRLPSALAHARRLGVDRAILIDNGSRDGTRAVAEAERGWVHLIDAPGSYAGSNFGVDWTNAVLDRWARGHWVLVLDADEVLVFPGSERDGSLRALCAHLDAIGSEALRAVLLDCFPAGPLHEMAFRPGDDLVAAAPFFEPPRLREEPCEHFPYVQQYGGLRERVFFPEADPRRPARFLHRRLYNLAWRLRPLRGAAWFRALAPRCSPNLTKVPLVRWREGARLIASTHMLAPMAMAAGQPTGVLLHFKFLQDFHARALDAVARGAHFDDSREYRRYLAALAADPQFRLHGPRSVGYSGPDQLLRLGLMRDSEAWRTARADAECDGGAPHVPARHALGAEGLAKEGT